MPTDTDTFRMSRPELISLIAMMFATIAFSIDAMLPALPQIGTELTPDDLQRAPLIISAFIIGMGAGTFVTGPLSDAFGRRPIILAGALLYIAGSAAAWASQTLEIMLVARVVQGLGAAGPRVVAMAVVRDLFAGREMARIVSLTMIIFTLVPAVAPLLGAQIIAAYGWRAIFMAFILFSLLTILWFGIRLPETLSPENRRPLKLSLMFGAVREMFAHPMVRLSIFAQSLCMAMLFLTLMQVHQIYSITYDREESFPYWFCIVALIAGSGSFFNAILVVRLGMRLLITAMLAAQIVISGAFLLLDLGGGEHGFYFFVCWQTCIFFQAGLTLGNLNALAMEPMGHIAGMAASVIGAFATVAAALISAPLGTLFDGTARPLALSVLVMAGLAFAILLRMRKLDRVPQGGTEN